MSRKVVSIPFDFIKGIHLAVDTRFEAEMLCSGFQMRSQDEDDYEYEIFSILMREPASFWRENVIAVVILQRDLARTS